MRVMTGTEIIRLGADLAAWLSIRAIVDARISALTLDPAQRARLSVMAELYQSLFANGYD